MKAKKIIGIILMVASLGLSVAAIQQTSAGIPAGTASPFFPVVILFAIGAILVFYKPSKKRKERREKWLETHAQALSTLNNAIHVNGLPLAENSPCKITFEPTLLQINASGNMFTIAYNKITDMMVKTDTDLQTQYVSSIAGAVGGAALLGPLGAILGGRVKQKKSTTVTKYLIVTYISEDDIKHCGFELNESESQKAEGLATEYASLYRKSGAVVEL